MRKLLLSFPAGMFILLLLTGICAPVNSLYAQIYEPEGLNMPGSWDSWTNPPANLAFASNTEVTGGRVTKITTGTTRWQTIFSVAATGADITGGTYDWLFTSGPASNAYQNKWANITVAMNTLQQYNYGGSNNNSITVANGKWYTMNWEDLGYVNTRAIFMETSAQPVDISTVSVPASVAANAAAPITVTISAAKCAEEIIYLRYTTDAWATSAALPVTMSGTTGTVDIPGQAAGTVVAYYAFTSTIAALSADYDLCTIKVNNNTGTNYSYTVAPPPPVISWANLQFPGSGAIETGQSYVVYGQAYIAGVTGQTTPAPGLQAWVGYSTTDTDPSTWTNWLPATYLGPVNNNDEFTADLGANIATSGIYYYATRFQLNSDAYVYGGYSATGGGFWDGTSNLSGQLTITDPVPNPDFDWVNLQYPGSGTIQPGAQFDVYAQSWIDGVTGQATAVPGEQAWIGFSEYNTNPSTWINWVPATFNGPSGNNDEFIANIGAQLNAEGTFYYASRFQLNTGQYYYGGYSSAGGGFWDGTNNVSGVVTVQNTPPDPGIDWANLQYPGSGSITVGGAFDVFAQAYIEGTTGQSAATPGLEAWIGYSTTNTDPSTWTNWVPATYNSASGNNDEFKADIGPEFTQPGTWYYASRFSLNAGPYVYGGFSETGGGFWDGTANVSGALTVNAAPQTYPVLFTIIDATQLHNNIKFKGQMTNWDTVAMVNENHTWTVTIDVAPGTYEWGAIEADGTPDGIWLIEGPNLSMTVDETGNVSGTVSYTTYVTSVNEVPADLKIYPNPVTNLLNVEMSGQPLVTVSDMAGRILFSKHYDSGNFKIDLSEMNTGVYSVVIVRGDKVIRQTIIKN